MMDCRVGGEHAHGQGVHFFESSCPHFFKIMLHDTVQNGKLRIPKKFARKHWKSDLSGNQHRMVSLKVPSGDVWDVEMEACDDNQLCFHRGWPEFVDFYGIKHGHFLVFKYERRGIFHVCIFNMSATEIKYPIKSSSANKDEENIHLEEVQPHRDIMPQMPNERPNPQPPTEDEVISIASTENAEIEDTYTVGYSKKETKPQMSKRYRESHNKSRGGSDKVTYKQRLKRAERDRALERTSCSESRRGNPYFSIFMRPSYVNRRWLSLPREFFLERLKLKKSTTVELRTSARRSWTVKYFYNVYNKSQGRTCTLTTGWGGFVEDNELVEGDVCCFELIKSIPTLVFHVTVSRAPKNPALARGSGGGFGDFKYQESIQCSDSDKLRGKRKREDRVICSQSGNMPDLASVSSSALKNVFFRMVMTQRYLSGSLSLPRQAARRMLMFSKQTVKNLILQIGDRTWRVSVSHYPKYRSAYLSTGWVDFTRENLLKLGDICSFELVDSKKLVMRVSIRRANDDER